LLYAPIYHASTISLLVVAGRRVEDYGTHVGGDPTSFEIRAFFNAMTEWLARCGLDVHR